MSTPRRGVRRPAPSRRPAPEPVAGVDQPSAASETPAVPAAAPIAGRQRAVEIVGFAAWVVLWLSAVGAGYFLGRPPIAKALFIVLLLAITVLPWVRWLRPGTRVRISTMRATAIQGLLGIAVGFVLALTGLYLWAVAVIIVEMGAAMFGLLSSRPRPAQA